MSAHRYLQKRAIGSLPTFSQTTSKLTKSPKESSKGKQLSKKARNFLDVLSAVLTEVSVKAWSLRRIGVLCQRLQSSWYLFTSFQTRVRRVNHKRAPNGFLPFATETVFRRFSRLVNVPILGNRWATRIHWSRNSEDRLTQLFRASNGINESKRWWLTIGRLGFFSF